jgi:hypothetical protein
VNIPESAIEAVAEIMNEADDPGSVATISAALTAALPHLLADHRERLIAAGAERRARADDFQIGWRAREHAEAEAKGIRLALSYLDEMLR